MRKLRLISLCTVCLFACTSSDDNEITELFKQKESPVKLYSYSIRDTFFISVCLPENMSAERAKIYPVIFILDANLYFDVMASAIKKYSEVGLLPPAILIGIGYKNFQTMDSLRSRDLTFPKALPEYEMFVSGGADKFLGFINKELIPYIDSNYPVDKSKRVLMGHSLGGYFTLYALHRSLVSDNNSFAAYIAASPSTHYNHNFILKEFEKINLEHPNKIKTYITFGGLEDESDADSTVISSQDVLGFFALSLKEKNKMVFKGDLYSNLDHMDTGFPTFVKGVQWVFGEEQ